MLRCEQKVSWLPLSIGEIRLIERLSVNVDTHGSSWPDAIDNKHALKVPSQYRLGAHTPYCSQYGVTNGVVTKGIATQPP